MLCRMEDEDLQSPIVEGNWKRVLERLRQGSDAGVSAAGVPAAGVPAAALTAPGEPGQGLAVALGRLAARGLVEVEAMAVPAGATAAERFRVHPAVAEAGRRQAPAAVTRATDRELGDFWFRQLFAALRADIDPNSARLVERILELIELPSPQEVVAGAPEAVRVAIAAGDPEALGVALEAMPAAEAEALVERLRAVGVLG